MQALGSSLGLLGGPKACRDAPGLIFEGFPVPLETRFGVILGSSFEDVAIFLWLAFAKAARMFFFRIWGPFLGCFCHVFFSLSENFDFLKIVLPLQREHSF